MSLGPAGSYSPRAAECSSEICKTNLVSLLREAKQLVPTKEDMVDIAIRMTDEAEEHVASGSEEEIDSDGHGPERDGESAEITGSSSGTDLSSEGL